MTFKKACAAAKNDATACQIAKQIIASNKAGTPDRTAYLAFQDRIQELSLSVPNAAYWSPMIISVASK